MWYEQVNINKKWHSLIAKKPAAVGHPTLLGTVNSCTCADALKYVVVSLVSGSQQSCVSVALIRPTGG